MKRLRSYGEDLDDVGGKDWERREVDSDRSSSRRRFYVRPESLRRSTSSLYDRSMEDEREAMRPPRKRFEHEVDGADRRKIFDRYSCVDRQTHVSSSRSSYGSERMHRSESFSGVSREFPKGFRSERERSRREGCGGLSWRRCGKEISEEEEEKTPPRCFEDRGKTRSRDSSSGEQCKNVDAVKVEIEKVGGECCSSSEMEEGELEPDPLPEPSDDATVKAKRESQQGNDKSVSVSSSENDKKSGSFNGVSCEGRSLQIEVDQVTVNVAVHDGNDEHSELLKRPDEERRGEGDVLVEGEEQREILSERQRESEDLAEGIWEEEKIEDTYFEEKKEGVSTGSSSLPLLDTNLEMKHHLETRMVNDDGGNLEDKVREVHDREVEEDAENKMGAGIDIGVVLRKDKDIDQVSFEAEQREGKSVDLHIGDETDCFGSVKEIIFEEKLTLNTMDNKIKETLKDKGKSIAHTISNVADSAEDEDAVEGPSHRGFELVFRDHISQTDKVSSCGLFTGGFPNKKLKLEPLDLSLGLPGVLPDHTCKPPNSQPCSPGRTKSIQSFPSSFRTTSDGFTNSISFSSSQPFVHNPSCSLTQNSMDNYEQSVGSHPIFQGVDQVSNGTIWPSQTSIEPKWKGGAGTLFHRVLLNGNHSQSTVKSMNGQPNSNSDTLLRQPIFPRQASPPQSVGSHDMLSEHSKDKRMLIRERSFNSLSRSEQREGEDAIVNTLNVVERFIPSIVSEPLQVLERMLQDMTENSIEYLKDSICKILASTDKRGQIHTLQGTLQKRSDLTAETLIRYPRILLEILVALKTDLPDFLQKSNSTSLSDLVEIFHNLKCRNIACGNVLPVDDCDCKICSQKDGFCSACMCLICSKFDMASNTCSWVGCDVCLHWCHTDCGLRGSYIRNGRSSSVAPGATEMQFHCVACGHPSEMFGFVKEVFKMCSKDWKVENLAKELQYVRRIFRGSNDVRGKGLFQVAGQMLVKLEDKKKHSEVIKHIMFFLSETESTISNTPLYSPRKTSINDDQQSNALTFPREETPWLSHVSSGKSSRMLHKCTISGIDDDQICRQRKDSIMLQMNCERKPPIVDELESVVGFKQAEAKMYQERADNARREAEGLKRIAAAKNGKIDEEYISRVAKLQLEDADERRRKKLEELQEIERAHHDFISLKTRMEADIKDLLLKMEATRRNVNS